jgi:hypothetical protein
MEGVGAAALAAILPVPAAADTSVIASARTDRLLPLPALCAGI